MGIRLVSGGPDTLRCSNDVPDKESRLDTRQAINDFLASVERRALRMAQLAVGNTDDAMDIVQDSMMKLVQRYARKPESEWPPLFFRILQSRITDFYRRQGVRSRWRVWLDRFRRDDEDHEDALEAMPDPAGLTPECEHASNESIREINTALAELPGRQQQAFLLRAWQGMSTAETAYAMKCSEGSVKTHYSRALAALRDRLQGIIDD